MAAAFLAVHRTDKLLAVLTGLLMVEIAAENAAAKDYVRGPGSFIPTLLDELYALRTQSVNVQGPGNWILHRAKIRQVSDI